MENQETFLPIEKRNFQPNNFLNKQKPRKGQKIFLVCMLAIPIVNWLVFWLYVNLSSILLAFQIDVAGEMQWSLQNFETFWQHLTDKGNQLNISLKNTMLYFLSSAFVTMPLSLLVSYFLSKKILGYKFCNSLPLITLGKSWITLMITAWAKAC